MKQTVLLTGASSGIGYEMAKIFAANHYHLILIARNKLKLEEIKQELNNPQIEITVIVKDLSVPGAANEVYKEIKQLNKHVDILVNNAGYGMTGPFFELDLNKQMNMIQLNIIALTELTHLFVQDMIKNNFGRIINVGSVASFVATPTMSVYAATKAFVLSFSESLHSELKQKGDIAVTALCPGPTKTNFATVANVGHLEEIFNVHGTTAQEVALSGYNAMKKELPVVVPGWKFRSMVGLTRLLPRQLLQKILSKTNK
ncbi:SDR family NAD(P)-dependent oxidoreductase [Halalkalibacter akibai]|uniref:Short-chain dehydrogenase/reductase SDR n=1 Tax=Halalkalibacter akibai (strain ATCC 43226 / DSM 21942 / CIP 109018 / JCM 9157 / 1139) TaxID=1236973 RepID=W4QSD1_HALA3|nr:SDR family oxidoreductase [Halalkalibacter akibai]GAE34837.1 short-chain dehydrogenase/reductase SDR [Halalkalibacter akibai JCM 9157]